MNQLWHRITKELLQAGDIPDSPEQLLKYVRLHDLAEQVQVSGRSMEYLACLRPVLDIGAGIMLRRPGIGAAYFIRERVDGWMDDYPGDEPAAIAWCMQTDMDPATLWACDSARAFLATVRRFRRMLRISEADLRRAVSAFLEIDEQAEVEIDREETAGKRREDNGWLIERLCADYGLTPHDVVWKLSREEVRLLAEQGADRRRRDAAAKAGRPVMFDAHGRQGAALRALYALRDEIAAAGGTTPA